jgi:hypothetical protein
MLFSVMSVDGLILNSNLIFHGCQYFLNTVVRRQALKFEIFSHLHIL